MNLCVVSEEEFGEEVDGVIWTCAYALDKSLRERGHHVLHEVVAQWLRLHLEQLDLFAAHLQSAQVFLIISMQGILDYTSIRKFRYYFTILTSIVHMAPILPRYPESSP